MRFDHDDIDGPAAPIPPRFERPWTVILAVAIAAYAVALLLVGAVFVGELLGVIGLPPLHLLLFGLVFGVLCWAVWWRARHAPDDEGPDEGAM